MNKRIRQLAEQAGYPDYMTYGQDKVLEMFAELIVRECIDIAYEYDAPKMSGPGMIIAGRIDAHFGVEE